MADHLAKHSLYVDDFNKLRIIDPLISESTVEFKDQCADFIKSNSVTFYVDCEYILFKLLNYFSTVLNKI
ncbi:unnamed protein product [Hymenolepis diminuta]|uniref:Uncharacterized protein n=1 Tax=Hymenolepis diminuta TaxID=6216 RepID=A0A0R3SPZ1_HYMDI|nr:unnamed protein product [Hymenolepis diminuta]